MEPSADMHSRVLWFLRNSGPANTFRLARALGVDRHKLLDILRDLEQQGCVELKHGVVIFIKIQGKGRLEQAPVQKKKAVRAPAIGKKIPRNKRSKQRFSNRKLPQETSPTKIPPETSALSALKKENKILVEMNKNLDESAAQLKKELQSASKAKDELKKLKETIKKRQQRKKKEKLAQKPKRFALPKIKFPKINFSWTKKIPQMTALPKAAARKAKAKAAKISNRVYKQAKQFYAKLSK